MLSQHLSNGAVLQGVAYRYVIKKVLGQGAFGITYLAMTEVEGPLGKLPVNVALKEFFAKDLNGRSDDGSVREVSSDSIARRYGQAFQRESLNLSHMKHPGIIRVLEAFEANNTYYYAMEYVDGGSLDAYILSKGQLPEKEAIEALVEIGSALSYMHGQKMLHLDLKPKNIMRRADGSLMLIDFGLSKQYDSTGEPESSSTIGLGTPGYAPLEQANGSSSKNFAATLDVYALGATFYKMLTGKSPVDASLILNDGFPKEELLKAGVSENSISAIEKAMSPQRKNRPQSVSEFLSLLAGGVCSGVGAKMSGDADEVTKVSASPHRTPAEVPVSASGSKRRLWLWVVLGVLFGAGILSAVLYGPKEQRVPTVPPVQPDSIVSVPESPQASAPVVEKGSLKVVSTPSGAAIWLDGKNTGKTTPEILSGLSADKHTVVLKLLGFQEYSQSVIVVSSRQSECNVTLTKYLDSAKSSVSQNYTETDLGINMKMVYVAGGSFMMGATLEQGWDVKADEIPVHQVNLSGYYIGAFEVTQGQWKKVMGSNPSYFRKGDNYPVESVTRDEAQAFCRKLSRRTGKKYILPTEAQWEYAARGGNKNEETKYSGSNNIDLVAWHEGNSGASTHPVGMKRPNVLGLYDMSGNVCEWCSDWYGEYSEASQTNPMGPVGDCNQVMRGNGWRFDVEDCRVSSRSYATPGRYRDVGFRVVCLPLEPEVVQTGSLKIVSTPSGASIWLDGRNTGKKTPEILEELSVGKHMVVLKLSGHQESSKFVSVVSSCRSECNIALAKTSEPVQSSTSQNYTEMALGINMEMVYVEGGSFMMGEIPELRLRVEGYAPRQMTLSGYYIGAFEVTQGQWEKVMGNNPSYFKKGDNYPVENVSWDEASAFCHELSRRTGKKYVLPTEAQWEYAARGGNKNEGTKCSGSNDIDLVAWYGDNSGTSTHPVGMKRPNALGLYDMSGNVCEWCTDCSVRGGPWCLGMVNCVVLDRGSCARSERRYSSGDGDTGDLGFRVVCLP